MSANIGRLRQGPADRRSTQRFPAALPAILDLGSQRLCARLVDLGVEGGRIEMSVAPMLHSEVWLRCGTICISATVLWAKGNEFGLKFQSRLSDAQVMEQVRRTEALASRRLGKAQPPWPPQ